MIQLVYIIAIIESTIIDLSQLRINIAQKGNDIHTKPKINTATKTKTRVGQVENFVKTQDRDQNKPRNFPPTTTVPCSSPWNADHMK